jgi:organic radical activating enzyme
MPAQLPGMHYLMKKDAAYQMSLTEIDELLYYSEQSGYTFHYRLTGGEPLLWQHLLEGIKKLKASPSCLSISIISNAIHIEPVTDALMEMVDCLRISKYLYNEEKADYLERRYPKLVQVVDRQEFTKNPAEKISNSIPVHCSNPELMFYDRKVYACPHSKSLALRFGVELKLYNDMGMHYKEGIEAIRHNQEEELCTRCIGNKTVKKAMEQVLNVSGTNPNLERLAKRYKRRLLYFIPSHRLPRMMRNW